VEDDDDDSGEEEEIKDIQMANALTMDLLIRRSILGLRVSSLPKKKSNKNLVL
jgi:hypothetical protein